MTEDQIWVLWLSEHPDDIDFYAAEGEEFRDIVEGTTAYLLWRLGKQHVHTVAQVPIVGPLLARRAQRTAEGLRRDITDHNARHLARTMEETR